MTEEKNSLFLQLKWTVWRMLDVIIRWIKLTYFVKGLWNVRLVFILTQLYNIVFLHVSWTWLGFPVSSSIEVGCSKLMQLMPQGYMGHFKELLSRFIFQKIVKIFLKWPKSFISSQNIKNWTKDRSHWHSDSH